MNSPAAMRDTPTGVIINVAVVTRAGRDESVGVMGDVVNVRLKAPPVEGRANEALLHILAKRLEVPPPALTLIHGAAGHHKAVRLFGLRADVAEKRLFAP